MQEDHQEQRTENCEPVTQRTKFLAFLCTICPFCIAARCFPKSKYAAAMKKAEASCPACKAYARVEHRAGNTEQRGDANPLN